MNSINSRTLSEYVGYELLSNLKVTDLGIEHIEISLGLIGHYQHIMQLPLE
jgi:hypothetical protein